MGASLSALLHDPRHRRFWRLAVMLLCGTSAGFAFSPLQVGLPIEQADKLNHLLAFASIGCAAVFAQAPGGRAPATALLGCLIFGIFIEWVQYFIPGRQCSAADVLANMAGATVGVILAQGLRRGFAKAHPG